MAGTAGFALAMAAFQWWFASPSWPRTALLALAVGFGLVTKMSFPMFFAIGAVTIMVLGKKWPVVKGAAAIVGAFVIVDAVYFFGPVISSGCTSLSNSSAFRCPSATAASFGSIV